MFYSFFFGYARKRNPEHFVFPLINVLQLLNYDFHKNDHQQKFLYQFVNKTLTRSSHPRCSVRKGVLRNFAKFTGKHLCRVSFLIKLQVSGHNPFQATVSFLYPIKTSQNPWLSVFPGVIDKGKIDLQWFNVWIPWKIRKLSSFLCLSIIKIESE